jgi:N-methylhydantoinase A
MSRVLGVDVGGTYTDLFLFDTETGTARVAKVPSTRGREADGFLAGIATLTEPGQLTTIVHGTTVGTNALLEGKGAVAGLITTAGFRDVLAMRRRDRRQTWGLTGNFYPVIPRDRRIEVAERTAASGEILQPIDPAEIAAAARALLAQGATALCIVFLHSYANPANERAALEAARAVWPNEHVAISSDILPEIREFERTSTAALNAVLQPVVGPYLNRLDTALRDAAFDGGFLIVQSNGGVMSAATAAHLPVRTALSGPAAGVIAAAHIAVSAGFPDVITGDVGGTSFDVSLIAGGKPALAAQSTLDFGLVVRTPMIEITTIGAGGGSIARVDAAGLLRVGPQSAGSIPGPACYGAGGTDATVTDANLVLGRINAESPIGNRPALDTAAAAAAIETHVAGPLGLGLMQAAEAILRVANAHMAGALRLVSIERGHDPKRFAFMPFGGGGGLHAGALVREVGLACALVPRYPGVTSALGCVIADMRHDRVRTLARPLLELDPAALRTEMDAAIALLAPLLDESGLSFAERRVEHAVDMHYQGQTHTVSVTIDLAQDGSGAFDHASLAEAFATTYASAYGRLLPHVPIRVMNLRSTLIGARPRIDLLSLAPAAGTSIAAATKPSRRVWFGGWTDAAIYDRLALPVGAVVHGPAVLEQPDATTLIEPGQTGRVDPYGNLILETAA